MNKNFKNNLFTFLATLIIFGGIVVYAAKTYLASQVTYNNTTVDLSLDDISSKAGISIKKVCKFISNKYGEKGKIGAKYECDPGDGVKRYFYILEVRNNDVDLIMDRNITQGSSQTTMNYTTAMNYFRAGTGKSYKTSWKNVLNVDLPSAQAIADAVGNSTWRAYDNSSGWCLDSKRIDTTSDLGYCTPNGKQAWLYSYLRDCSSGNYKCESGTSLADTEAYGYWSKDRINNSTIVWGIDRSSLLNVNADTADQYRGVRPVITILKSNLYE